MSLQAVEEDDGEQLNWIEGFPGESVAFELASAKNLYTERQLKYGDRVEGRYAGRVKGIRTYEKSGKLAYVYVIEVQSGSIDKVGPA